MKRKKNKIKEYLFVDGYNIINYWKSLKDKSLISFEEAREELIEVLAEYHHYSGIEIIIVFDAHLVQGNNGKEYYYKGIQVVYTKESETADNYIERKLDDLGRMRKIRDATSDWLEQQIILSRGGTRISARELEIEVYNAKNRLNKKRGNKNHQNNMELGRLDKDVLNKLSKWQESTKTDID